MRKNNNKLTQERLKEVVSYDPESGVFIWIKDNKNLKRAGDVAGYISMDGYVVITIDQYLHRGHRLAWLYMTGDLPESVDHINRIRSDNRFCNLRAGSLQQNNCNKGLTVRNTSGLLGVSWNSKCGKWKAQVKSNGKQYHLGFYEDIELAGLVAEEARAKLHGEFASILRNIEEAK